MGEQTGIAWTDSTINVWHGCTKVDELCRNCYAEVSTPVRVKRAAGLEVWGPKAARSETKGWEANLRQWARETIYSAAGTRRVFGQSLSDTFEDRPDLDPLRARFFAALTKWTARSMTFQLLTKRPENILRMVPPAWLDDWPAHVWIGTSVGDRASAEKRIPELLKVPAPVRFLSMEPLLEEVDIERWLDDCKVCGGPLSWVIIGGESGPKARPFDLAWARKLVKQCRAAGVAVFMKQMGAHVVWDGISAPGEHWPEWTRREDRIVAPGWRVRLRDDHGGDPSEWPEDLRVREFPA